MSESFQGLLQAKLLAWRAEKSTLEPFKTMFGGVFPTAMFDDTGGYAFTSAGVDHRRLHQLRQHFVRRREFGTSLGGAILGCARPRNPLRKNSIEQLRFLILMVGPQKTGARVGFDASLCGCVCLKN